MKHYSYKEQFIGHQISRMILSIALGMSLSSCLQAAGKEADLFVAPGGNDLWSGKLAALDDEHNNADYPVGVNTDVKALLLWNPAFHSERLCFIQYTVWQHDIRSSGRPEDQIGPKEL